MDDDINNNCNDNYSNNNNNDNSSVTRSHTKEVLEYLSNSIKKAARFELIQLNLRCPKSLK